MKQANFGGGLVTLFYPVDENDLRLIASSGYREFPATSKHIIKFYYSLSQTRIEQVAFEWRIRGEHPGGTGYIVAFEMDAVYLERVSLNGLKAPDPIEHWVQQRDLPQFNSHIEGEIRTIRTFPIGGSRNNLTTIYSVCRQRQECTPGTLAVRSFRHLGRSWAFKPSRVVAELAGSNRSIKDVLRELYPGMAETDLTTQDKAYINRNIFWHHNLQRWDYKE